MNLHSFIAIDQIINKQCLTLNYIIAETKQTQLYPSSLIIHQQKQIFLKFLSLLFYSMKYNLTKDIASLKQLQQIASEWISNNTYRQQMTNKYHFKVSLIKLQALSPTFFINTITYSISRMLPWIITDRRPQQCVKLNKDLKKYYRQLLFKSFFKVNNMFEVMIMYLIKLTSCFLDIHFNNFLIDQIFQTELCIILYYTLLGIEINKKTYKILENKFIIKRCIPKQNRISLQSDVKLNHTPKNSFLSNNGSRSSMRTNPAGQKLSIKQIRMSRMSFVRPTRQSIKKQNEISEINALLKQNLYVPPLPPLKKRHINYREFERLQTEPPNEAQKFTITKLNQKQKYKYTKPKFIFSNQLSTSLKNYFPDSLLFQLNSKKVKITQTRQNLHKNRSLQTIPKQQEKHLETVKESQAKENFITKKVPAYQWTKVVSDLKNQVLNLQCKTQKQDPTTAHKTKRVNNNSSYSPSSTDIEIPNIQAQQVKAVSRSIKLSVPALVSKESESDSSSSEDDHTYLDQVAFKKQNEKISFVVQNLPNDCDKDLHKIFSRTKPSRKGRFLASSLIRCDQDLFFNLCKIRKGSILQTNRNQRLGRHDSWLVNQFIQ